MSKEDITLFCNCECGALVVTDSWLEDGLVGFSLYRYGTNNYDTSWRNRLRHILDIVRYGHPWADDILLQKKDVQRLKEYLESALVK